MKIYKKIKETIFAYLMITLGSVVTALGLNIFLVPNKIAAGGFSGVGTIVYYLSGTRIAVGTTILVLNIPLFLLAFKIIGKKFIFKSIYGTVSLSILVDVFYPYTEWVVTRFFTVGEEGLYSPNLFLYSLFGGLLVGAGLGLVVRSGATTGGSDLLSMLIRKFTSAFTFGQIIMFIDFVIIIVAGVCFDNFIFSLYGLIALYISSKVIDIVTEGVNYAKTVFIISDVSDQIADVILKEVQRGVTGLSGKGMYSDINKNILFCVIHKRQVTQLRLAIKKVDPNAFVVVTDAKEVFGEGFAV